MAVKPTAHNNITKFALYNFKGTPTRYFRVESEDFATPVKVETRKPSHHILVVDRSGSMYGDIPEVRNTLEKLLTLSEFRDPSLRVSLISYSSQGDVKLHFAKVTVEDVMAANSSYVKEIRSIQATCMTCISQGLVMAETLVDDADTTAITMHTDGYANDRSPMQESVAIKAAVVKLQKHPGVFVNCIGYREWCDYNLLSSIANALSGVCLQARGVKQVYESIYNTTKLLAGAVSPAIEMVPGKASYILFSSKSARKVLGSTGTLLVRGLSDKDDKAGYRLFDITDKDYAALKCPVNGEDAPVDPILAFARTQLAEGAMNVAKYAMVATRCGELLGAHSRALVSSDIAAMAGGLENHLFDKVAFIPTPNYGLPFTGPSVLTLLTYLNEHSSALSVNLPDLASGYKRRGVKRIPGTRLADGTVEVPTVSSKTRDGDGWVRVNGFELNRNTATVNMLLSQAIDLFPKGGNTRVASVAGVNLDNLRSYNNYTLVGDGSLNVQALNLRSSDQKIIEGLKLLQAPIDPNAKAGQPFTLTLSGLPLVDYDLNVSAAGKTTVQRLARLTVLGKILNGMVKGDPSGFTPEQMTELKAHYLTPALYFSPPMTNEYADLNVAIAQGKVDTKLSYKVDLGTPDLTNLGKLKSGNEYLQRRFTLKANGTDIEKPTLDYVTMPGSVWGIKALSAKTVLDSVDDVSYPIYEGLLGLGKGVEIKDLLKSVGCVDPDRFLADIKGAGAKDAVRDAIKFVDDALESIYQTIRPLAFYVGATGLVPDTMGAKAMTADELVKAHPSAKLSKAEKEEGSFFVLPDGSVLTVYVKAEHFSTTPATA